MIILKTLKVPTTFCTRAFGSLIKSKLEKDKSSRIVSILRNAIKDKNPIGETKQGEGLKDQSIDYYDLSTKLKNISEQDDSVAHQLREVQESIKKAQEETFIGTPEIYKLLSTGIVGING